MYETLRGTGVALVTPFKRDLTIDYDAFKRLLDFNADNGVDYFVVNGTTGESATTNKAEKHALLDFIRKNNKKNLPIVYGTGGYDTQDIVDHVKELDWTGVAALLSVSPYYNRPSQAGIIAHYRAIADACPKPVILYNVPKRTGANMKAATTLELARHENIIGIKEANNDFDQIIEILADKPEDFLVISGDDMNSVPMISLGCAGLISVLANAFPKEMSDMVRFALDGDFGRACALTYKLSKINPYMYAEGSPVGIKEVLGNLGLMENYVRLPHVTASEGLKKKIKSLM